MQKAQHRLQKIVSWVKKPVRTKEKSVEVNSVTKDIKIRCIDFEYLLTCTKSNPILMMEMISLYLKQTLPLVSAMQKGMEDKDWDFLYAAVHKMIPSFSSVGINPDFVNMAKKKFRNLLVRKNNPRGYMI